MKPYFLAVNYHYIGEHDRYPYPGIVGVSSREFEAQLDELSKYFDFVGIKEISGAILEQRPLPEKSLLITLRSGEINFDYANYQSAGRRMF